MRNLNWIKVLAICVVIAGISSCASKLSDVADAEAPTMKDIYESHTGWEAGALDARKAMLLRRPALHEDDVQVGLPPYAERLNHLYPRLPNPDLVMYVRPHVVGISGAPIPAYITRFTMYERQPYALPGESLESLRIDNQDRHDAFAARKADVQSAAEVRRKKITRTGGVQ